MTAPFRPEAEELIRGTLTNLLSVRAIPMFGEEFPLAVTSVTCAFDESWVPHIQATATIPMPSDEQLDLLDARLGCRVEITAGYRYAPEEEETLIMADLQLRNREIDHESNTVTLRLESREAILMDYMLRGTEDVSRASLMDFVYDAVGLTLIPGEAAQGMRIYSMFSDEKFAAELQGEPATITTESTELRPELGKSAWELLEEGMRRTGTWIYAADGHNFLVDKRPEIAATPVHTLTVGEGGTVLSARSSLGVEDFYNEVILEYKWQDADKLPAEQAIYGQARALYGPYSVKRIRTKTYLETIDRRISQKEADAAARDKLSRLLTRGHEYTVHAVAALWVRPGETVALVLDGKTERLLVKSVQFELGDGTMTVVLRTPEISTISSENN